MTSRGLGRSLEDEVADPGVGGRDELGDRTGMEVPELSYELRSRIF